MQPKRILLMYISEVSGHRSAAMAIEKAIKKISPEAEVLNIDAFNYTNPVWEKIINRIYMWVLNNAPQIWDYLYDNPKIVKMLSSLKNAVNKHNSPKLKKLFSQFKPDVVACTQAFPCGMVADYKSIYKSELPLVAVLTDYVPHSFWIYENINYYVSPSEEVTQKLIKKNVAREKIKTFGIPFDPKFNLPTDTGAVLKNLSLEEGLPTFLIMGGSHGLGPIKTIINSLEKVKEPIQEIIVTGSNRKLYKSLTKEVQSYQKKITVLGFADNINELMDVSSLIITKPGGITVAEALAKKIPMLIIKPLPGQEANNTQYLTQMGAAIKVDNLEEIYLLVEDLLKNTGKLESLRESSGKISKPNASLDIARLILELK